MGATKTFTLRLPADLYARCSKQADKRQLSLNSYMQESLGAALKLEEDQALYEAFGRYGSDPSRESDVEYAVDAQKEALLKNDPAKTR